MHCAHVKCVNACVECVDACVDDASWCTRWCTRECACDTVYVNTHTIQSAWMRMRCSLRECAYNAVCVFPKSIKSIKSSLLNPNNHY